MRSSPLQVNDTNTSFNLIDEIGYLRTSPNEVSNLNIKFKLDILYDILTSKMRSSPPHVNETKRSVKYELGLCKIQVA